MSFTEAIPPLSPRRRTTTRLRTQIGRCVGEAARSVIEVADGAGVFWPTAHAAFVALAESLAERRLRPERSRQRLRRNLVCIRPFMLE